jgi:predicted nuclease of restriction endonuclease-like RecB superfamily
MLPTSLVRVRQARNRLVPQYLDASLDTWRWAAEELLDVYRGSLNRTRGEIDDDVEQTVGNHPARLVYLGLAKLLEDRSEFEVVAGHPPDELRDAVFRAAAEARATGTFDRAAVLARVATQFQLEPAAVERSLFADLKSEQRLVKFDDTTAVRLIERYNVALAQAILLRASRVEATVRNAPPARLRQLLRAIKFHRLICDIARAGPDSLTLTLDGPLSLFSATQKYGLQLAMFLPTLLLCRNFDLRAEVGWGAQRKEKLFVVTSSDGLVSHLPDYGSYTPPELAMFAEQFRKKVADWDLVDESEVIPLGPSYWVPDYRLVHRATGRWIYLEVLGFWRRASAEAHLARLKAHATRPYVLAVSEQLHIEDAALTDLPAGIHIFRNMPLPDEIARLASLGLA